MQRILTSLLFLTLALPASAELYKWTDATGRTHFSDQPPAGTRKAEALPAPTATPLSKAAAGTGGAAAGAPDEAARRERMQRLQEAWREEEQQREQQAQLAQKEAEEKRRRQVHCHEVRDELKEMDGVPVYVMTPEGQRQFLDEDARRKYIDDSKRYLQENCQ